jgi:hypothetical protein
MSTLRHNDYYDFWSRALSSTTHFARCVSSTKTTARGFWAWRPVAARWPRVCLSAPPPLPLESATVESYYAIIVAAAGRAQRLR